MSQWIITIAIALCSAAFAAGGASWQIRRQARDLNGLGRKYYRLVAMLVRWADHEDKEIRTVRLRALADILEGK